MKDIELSVDDQIAHEFTALVQTRFDGNASRAFSEAVRILQLSAKYPTLDDLSTAISHIHEATARAGRFSEAEIDRRVRESRNRRKLNSETG